MPDLISGVIREHYFLNVYAPISILNAIFIGINSNSSVLYIMGMYNNFTTSVHSTYFYKCNGQSNIISSMGMSTCFETYGLVFYDCYGGSSGLLSAFCKNMSHKMSSSVFSRGEYTYYMNCASALHANNNNTLQSNEMFWFSIITNPLSISYTNHDNITAYNIFFCIVGETNNTILQSNFFKIKSTTFFMASRPNTFLFVDRSVLNEIDTVFFCPAQLLICFIDSYTENNFTGSFFSSLIMSKKPTISLQLNTFEDQIPNNFFLEINGNQNKGSSYNKYAGVFIHQSIFSDLYTESSGGAVFIEQKFYDSTITETVFLRCVCRSSFSEGGAVYYCSEDGVFISKKVCGSECSSYRGQIFFVITQKDVKIDQICTYNLGSFNRVTLAVFVINGTSCHMVGLNNSCNLISYMSCFMNQCLSFLSYSAVYNNTCEGYLIAIRCKNASGFLFTNFISNTQKQVFPFLHADFLDVYRCLFLQNTGPLFSNKSKINFVETSIDHLNSDDDTHPTYILTTIGTLVQEVKNYDFYCFEIPSPTEYPQQLSKYQMKIVILAFSVLLLSIVLLISYMIIRKSKEKDLESRILLNEAVLADFG